MPSRFLSSCPYYTKLETKDWKLLRDEMLPEHSETVLSTLITYLPCRTPISITAVFQFKSLFCFNHDSLLLGAP